jgi:hypothetical protein
MGAGASTEVGAGAFNLVADGADIARALSIGVFAVAYALIVWDGWRRRTPPLEIATAILAVAVLLAPVLSPQFLFWLLPLSAAAYGWRLPNLMLIVAIVLTEVMLALYSGVDTLETSFILAVSARNAVLLAYVAVVVALPFRAPAPEPAPALGWGDGSR